jgi:hypothetical protein
MTCTNMFVTIDATPERLPGIVQVKQLEAIQPNELFELPKSAVVAVS